MKAIKNLTSTIYRLKFNGVIQPCGVDADNIRDYINGALALGTCKKYQFSVSSNYGQLDLAEFLAGNDKLIQF